MRIALILILTLLSQYSMAAVKKPAKKVELGLVRKNAFAEVQFRPETDPNKRDLEKERYTTLDKLEWQNQAFLNGQGPGTEPHAQDLQQTMFNQAMQNLPKIPLSGPSK